MSLPSLSSGSKELDKFKEQTSSNSPKEVLEKVPLYQLPMKYTNKMVSKAPNSSLATAKSAEDKHSLIGGTFKVKTSSNLEQKQGEHDDDDDDENGDDTDTVADDEDYEDEGNEEGDDEDDAAEGGDGDDKEGDGDGDEEDNEKDSKENDEAEKEEDSNKLPMISNSMAIFSLASINPHIICTLCNGYFRDPYTITECLHAFCKSCLFFAFQSGFRKCPKCEASLEPDPYREVLSDRTLGELVHKILPELKEKDDIDENKFYERRGIKRKLEFRRNEKEGEQERLQKEKAEKNKRDMKIQDTRTVSLFQSVKKSQVFFNSKPNVLFFHELFFKTGDEINFTLIPAKDVPEGYTMPPLQNPLLRTSGKV